MTTIITKNSSTGGAVPTAGVLTQGELAVNVTDKKLYTKNSSGVVVELAPTTVATADALTTARAISLSGGVTGTVNFNGSAPVDIVSTVNFGVNNATAADTVTLGLNAGAAITSGCTTSTLIGSDAGKTLTGVATAHTAIGYKAMELATLGSGHIAIGPYALQDITNTNFCTAVGWGAGISCTTGGLSSTFVGNAAGGQITTGSQNTCIGYGANPSTATTSYQFTLGTTDVQSLRCNVTTITSLSDARDKTDIIDTPYGLDFINTLQPRQFKWETRDGNIKDGNVEQGFIAQELLQAVDGKNNVLNLVLEDNPDRLEASAGNLVPVLVKAIQELTARVAELENN